MQQQNNRSSVIIVSRHLIADTSSYGSMGCTAMGCLCYYFAQRWGQLDFSTCILCDQHDIDDMNTGSITDVSTRFSVCSRHRGLRKLGITPRITPSFLLLVQRM